MPRTKKKLVLNTKASRLRFMKPMLATLTTDYFSSSEWLYEHKFDGQRCMVLKKNGVVRLMSRTGRVINIHYPELVAAFAAQRADNFLVDGEIVAEHNGISDFQRLQSRIHRINASSGVVPVVIYLFDVLYEQGIDMRIVPLIERKKVLHSMFAYTKSIKYTKHRVGSGVPFFKKACALGWEGVMAKKAHSPYVCARSRQWLKFKCSSSQELVIGGYTQPHGKRTNFGALLVGYYERGSLRFAGKVGTGFSHETLALVGKKMRARIRKTSPFVDYQGPEQGVYWVTPDLVVECAFAQWTAQGRLRVGRYKGLRLDKNARNVVKEVAGSAMHLKK
jgi:bifunctional non-homologous end joining protein LigD